MSVQIEATCVPATIPCRVTLLWPDSTTSFDRLATFVPASAAGRWLAAGSVDSHLGVARTLILPGRIGPATRESA